MDSSADLGFSSPASKRPRKTELQLQNGYDCMFVKEIPDYLPTECPICLCVLDNPQLIDCNCGSHFCQSCINPIKAEKKPCPVCKGPFATSILDCHLQRTLNNLKVYCSLKDAGCKWMGELKNLSQHLDVDRESDSSKCSFVQLKCSHCRKEFQRQHLLNHERSECLKRPIRCNVCDEYTSTFEDVTNNHMPVCPSEPIPCPKKCGKFLPRKNLDKHLGSDCPLQEVECLFGCEVKLLRKDMAAHVNKSLVFHMHLQASNQKKQLQKQVSMQSEIDDLKLRLEEKEHEIESMKEDIEELKSQQNLLHTHIGVVPVHLVLSDFVAKKKEGAVWHSQPFYSRPHGYKMRMKVYANGHKDGTNTHISVYIQLMCGEFDNQLDWPFQGFVSVKLLDQEDDTDHWSQRIDFDDELLPDVTPQVRKGERNTEWGIDKFIHHDMLSSQYYHVKNDSLYFEVDEVKSNTVCCIM